MNTLNMQEIEEELFLNIAGFIINVRFYKPQNINHLNRMRQDIYDFFTGFIEAAAPSHFDFIVEVYDMVDLANIQVVRKGNKYVLFSQEAEGKTKTFYQISIFQFQLVIQNILDILLAKHQGFIFHASASEIDGKAYLFSGNSGVGKSTAVKLLSRSLPILSDDFSLIRKIKGKYMYFQHPFPEKNYIAVRKSFSRPIGKLFFLKKTKEFNILKLTNKPKITKLMIEQLITPHSSSIESAMEFGSMQKQIYTLGFMIEEAAFVKFIKENK